MALGSASLHYCRVAASKGNTYYVDGAKGHDDAAGSTDAPWATVDHAIKTIKAGDTVVVAAGLYHIADHLAFGPPGTGHDALTTFRAAPGARVLFTSPAGEPPNEVVLHDYVRLEGLWFGGTRVPDKEQGCDITAIDVGSAFHLANLDGPMGHGKELVGCTFFSYSEVGLGSNEDVIFSSNRFIRTGRNCHAHVLNNLFGPASQLEGDFVATDSVKNNGFLGVPARGDSPLTVTQGQEMSALGISAADLDATVAALRQAFTQPVEKIFADSSIEPSFAKLSFALPAGSSLEKAGAPWLGASPMPIGSAASTPACIEDLWDAFHAQGLRDVDRFAKLPDGSSP
jgi:hypothetical protein